jgi:molybdate transport system substrate-binding protein
MRAKSTLGQGGYVVEPVGRGEVELGIHQISEILPVKGVRLAGPLPRELQKYTVYAAAPVPGTAKASAVAQFIAYLAAPGSRERLAAAGYSAPE